MAGASVAVLLPVRNGGAALRACLDSLRAQTFGRFRVVAVDDGSTDDTPEILHEAAASWSRDAGPELTVLRQDHGTGIPRALVAAVSELRDETLLARQDADDVSFPERFARQVAYLEAHPDIGAVATDIRTDPGCHGPGGMDVNHLDPGKTDLDRPDPSVPTDGWRRYEAWLNACHTPREIALNLWIESPLPHPTVMMRREAYEQVGGYRDLGWPEDYDLWLRMHRAGIALAKLPEVLYGWCDHPDRTSRTHSSYTAERFLACRAHHLVRFLGDRSIVIWGAGRDGRRAARALIAEGARIEAFLDIDPRKIGRRAYGRPILAVEEWLGVRTTDGATVGDPIVLAAVGTAGARDLIRSRLSGAALREGPDFLCIC